MSKVILTPRAALRLLSRPLLIAFAFSFFVNVLALTLPIYMMVVYDKVLSSRSLETLIALSVMAVFALVCYGLLEAVRARIAQGIDRWLDENLTGEIQRLQLENAAAAHKKLPGGLGDLRTCAKPFPAPLCLPCSTPCGHRFSCWLSFGFTRSSALSPAGERLPYCC